MTAALTTLPTELLYDITEYLDRQSVVQCALTCRLLAKIVAAKLWKVIPRLTTQKTIQLFQALSTSPNAGTEILEINITGIDASRFQSIPPPPTFHEVIARGLAGLFQFSMSQSSTPTVFTARASELSFQSFSIAFRKMSHLHKLVIHGPFCPRLWGFHLFISTLREVLVYREAESIELLGWIKVQSNLTRLRLWVPQHWTDGGSFLLNKRTIWLPQLQSLTTTRCGAKILLQRSSVSDLIIEDIDNVVRGKILNAHDLAKTIKQEIISGILERLTLAGRDDDVLNLLVLLQGHLPDFHSLRIIFSNHVHAICNHARGACSFPSSVYTTNVESFLRTTPTLERFELWTGFHAPQYADPEIRVPKCELIVRTEGVLVREWAKICPRLGVVRFPTHTKWLVDRPEGGLPEPRLEYPAWESAL